MSTVAERLQAAGIELPVPPAALAAYVPAVRAGSFVFTAGQLPMRDGSLLAVGQVAEDVDPLLARECASLCAANALAAAATVCSLDDIVGVAKLVGYVASDPAFTAHSAVVDGASEVMSVAFGEAGRHAREAVGVAALPLDAPVEVSVVFVLDGRLESDVRPDEQ